MNANNFSKDDNNSNWHLIVESGAQFNVLTRSTGALTASLFLERVACNQCASISLQSLKRPIISIDLNVRPHAITMVPFASGASITNVCADNK